MAQKTSKKVNYNPISEAKIHEIISAFFVFVVLIICTHILADTMHSRYIYYSNIQTEETFVNRVPYVKRHHFDAFNFDDVKTVDIMFGYIMTNFVQIIHEDDRNDTASPHLLNVGLIIGVPRLRQLRINPMKKCVHDVTVDKLDERPCYTEYSPSIEFKGNYKGVDYKHDAKSFWANFYRYTGGGFSVNMFLNPADNYALLNSLHTSRWVDRATRLVVLEFSVFYDGNQMFQIIKLKFQILPTGLVIPSQNIRCIPVNCFLFKDTFSLIVGIIFYIIVMFYTYHEIYEIVITKPKTYFRTFENYPDLCFLLTAYWVLGYNIWHKYEVTEIYKAYNKNRDDYINLDNLLIGWEGYSIIMGTLTFSVWIKFVRFMSFHRTLKRLAATVRLSLHKILGFFFIYVVVIYAFSQLGTMVFGEEIKQFKSNYNTIITIMRVIMSDVHYLPMHRAQPILAPIYFVSLIVTVYGISLNLFVAIYLSTYSDVKEKMVVKDRLVLKLIARGFKSYFCIWGRRPPLKKEIETFSIQPIIDEQLEKDEETLESRALKEEPMMRLREELAIYTERSLQIETMLESLVVTIENIAELQKQKQKQNA